jgi:hypothetical protein
MPISSSKVLDFARFGLIDRRAQSRARCFGVSDRSAFCALQSATMLRNRETNAVTFDVHVRLTHRISQTGVQNPAVAVQSMLT